jgi:ABC-type nitrate/sulfonate/bicarbonate transport system permease component
LGTLYRVIIAVIWFSNTELGILFVILITSFPFYAMNVLDGIKSVPLDYVEMIKSFRPRASQIVRFMIIPYITPYVLTTAKVVLGYATRIVIIAELVEASLGVVMGAGVYAGATIVKHVSERAFTYLVEAVSVAASIALIVLG